jgi:hypothetical protein
MFIPSTMITTIIIKKSNWSKKMGLVFYRLQGGVYLASTGELYG